jgi:hypothetical protein
MRLRARRIRQRVAGLAVALFSAAFLTVYVQLASGHDPALTASARRRAASSTAPRAPSREFSGSEAPDPQEEAGASEEATAEGPSSVTSRQS